jgi:LacI family repressor for deo operon, udp, cdd, tsx, nupC, and nupG
MASRRRTRPGGLADSVSMSDVAERAGVSISTVSRALRGQPGVGEPARARIRAIAEDLMYVVSPEASSLARRETDRVAVVVPRIDVWFYSAMLAGVESVLRDAGMDVLLYQIDGQAQRSRFFQQLPVRRKVDAVVLVALPMLPAEIDRLDLMGVHVVVAGGRLRSYPFVEVDDHAVGTSAVDHLVELGHRRIAMIRTSDTDGTAWSSDLLRTQGYRAALANHDLPAPPDYLVTEAYGVDAGARGIERLLALEEPPTAVFAYSDEIAVSALRALQMAGLRVPDDISLIGADGHPLGELFGITTLEQSVVGQGRLAAETVVALLRGQEVDPAVQVPTRLVDRGSTAQPPTPR